MSYAVSILLGALRRDGILEASRILCRIFMQKCIRRRSSVFIHNYSVDGTKIMGAMSKKNVVITQIIKWRDIADDEKTTLRNHGSYIWSDLEAKVKKGAILWLLYIEECLAGAALSAPFAEGNDYFVTIKISDLLISHCVVFSGFRGRGLYTLLLKYVICEVKKNENPCPDIYISCLDWNIGSIKAIEKSGFSLIGYEYQNKRGRHFDPVKHN